MANVTIEHCEQTRDKVMAKLDRVHDDVKGLSVAVARLEERTTTHRGWWGALAGAVAGCISWLASRLFFS